MRYLSSYDVSNPQIFSVPSSEEEPSGSQPLIWVPLFDANDPVRYYESELQAQLIPTFIWEIGDIYE